MVVPLPKMIPGNISKITAPTTRVFKDDKVSDVWNHKITENYCINQHLPSSFINEMIPYASARYRYMVEQRTKPKGRYTCRLQEYKWSLSSPWTVEVIKVFSEGWNNNLPTLVQIMARRRIGDNYSNQCWPVKCRINASLELNGLNSNLGKYIWTKTWLLIAYSVWNFTTDTVASLPYQDKNIKMVRQQKCVFCAKDISRDLSLR